MSNKVIALDLDGVLTDIGSQILKSVPNEYSVQLITDALFNVEANHLNDVFENPLFWRNLKPIKDSWHCVNKWFSSGYDVFFVTARRSSNSIDEIANWLEGWKIGYNDFIVTDQMGKHDVIKKLGACLYVDDNPFEIEKIRSILDIDAFVMKTWYNEKIINKLPFVESLAHITIGT